MRATLSQNIIRTQRRTRAIELLWSFYILTAHAPAFAACTERQKVCYAYSEKTYNNAQKCTDAAKIISPSA
jgi:hypothetical protein